jgi:hypothetical protein
MHLLKSDVLSVRIYFDISNVVFFNVSVVIAIFDLDNRTIDSLIENIDFPKYYL